MTRSMTEALNAPILFREKVQAVRGRLDKRQVSPAGAMLGLAARTSRARSEFTCRL